MSDQLSPALEKLKELETRISALEKRMDAIEAGTHPKPPEKEDPAKHPGKH